MIATYDLGVMLPVIAPLLAAFLCLAVDLIRPVPPVAHLGIAAVGILGGLVAALLGLGETRGAFCVDGGGCLAVVGPVDAGLQVLVLLGAGAVLALAAAQWPQVAPDRAPVLAVLMLIATAGAVALPAARDVGSWWVGLLLATLPMVGLVALAPREVPATRSRTDRRGGEIAEALIAATPVLASFALLALAGALWYLATGTALMTGEAVFGARGAGTESLLAASVVLGIAGAAVPLVLTPFHGWGPLIQRAAPGPVVAHLSTVSVLAGLGALLVPVRALIEAGAITAAPPTQLHVLGLLAVLSMTAGNLMALRQREPMPLLAWLVVAQSGWLVLPLAAVTPSSSAAAVGYALVLVVALSVAFACVLGVRSTRPAVAHAPGTALGEHVGLVRRRPTLGLPLAFALLTLAGLPPAIAGLSAKILVLAPVAGASMWWVGLVAVANLALGLVVALRWIFVLARPGDDVVPAEPDTGDRADDTEDLPAPDGDDTTVAIPATSREAAASSTTSTPSAPEPPTHRTYLAVAWIGTAVLLVTSVAPGLLFSLLG